MDFASKQGRGQKYVASFLLTNFEAKEKGSQVSKVLGSACVYRFALNMHGLATQCL